MEFSLHQQLKQLYADQSSGTDCETEVTLDQYRIDVVREHDLVEIQVSGLAAIRDKIKRLLKTHRVTVVKPIVARKWIVKLEKSGGKQVSRRLSPKKGNPLTIFDELVYFTRVFPHSNLTLETPLVSIEEIRYPGHGRRRRRRESDFRIEDQTLVQVEGEAVLRDCIDLWNLIDGEKLPETFGTKELASHLQVDRWDAQRIAYCLRETGTIKATGKNGNAILYEAAARPKKKRQTRRKKAS